MIAEPLFEVLDGGLLTTIQDAGRPEWVHVGVPESGAADPFSLGVANILLDNDPGAAVLEATIVGPALRALRDVTVALAGADLGGRVGGRRVAAGRTHALASGDVLELPGRGSGGGCRAVLAVPGGFDVPEVLGSRSTCVAAAFGGVDGRPLRAGDLLRAGTADGAGSARAARPGLASSVTVGADRVWPGLVEATDSGTPGPPRLRVIAGPAAGLDAVIDAVWRVAPASDRVGVRLDGPPLSDHVGGEVTTHGVPWGAIQVPPDGRPIVLGPDHQTTGGYRVVGVVISADRPRLGQLAPGAEVRLAATTHDAALTALREQRRALRDGAAAMREVSGWDALAHAAGG